MNESYNPFQTDLDRLFNFESNGSNSNKMQKGPLLILCISVNATIDTMFKFDADAKRWR